MWLLSLDPSNSDFNLRFNAFSILINSVISIDKKKLRLSGHVQPKWGLKLKLEVEINI